MIGTLIASLAGVVNAFYLAPLTRDARQNQRLWLVFALFAFLLIPGMLFFSIFIKTGFLFSASACLMMVPSGLSYGLGMVLLMQSVSYIGMGIPYVLSLVLATISGSLTATILFHDINQVSSLTWLGYGLFIIAAVLVSLSLVLREGLQSSNLKYLGLCILGSILLASQGATLSYFSNEVKLQHLPVDQQLIPWVLIYIFASIVVLGYYFKQTKSPLFLHSTLLPGLAMVVFYWVSIGLYNVSNDYGALLSEKYNWVVFMTIIS